MGAFVSYLIKVAVCLMFFFLFAKLVFSRDTFHKFNRVAWLMIVPLSLMLPFFDFGFWELFREGSPVVAAEPVIENPIMVATPVEAKPDNSSLVPAVMWTVLTYGVGVVSLLLYFIVSYLRLVRFIFLNRKMEVSAEGASTGYLELLRSCKWQLGFFGKVHLIITGKNLAPFSWMNYIVVSEEDMRENGREVLIHELSHIKGHHSLDVMLMDMFIIFQWFNPAVWLTKRSLLQVHEYCADESVIDAGVNAKEYQLLLIKKAVGQRLYSMANSFNHSKLKKRITMMLKEKSSKWAYAKCLYAIPMALIAASAFAAPKVSDSLNELSSVKITQNSEIPDSTVQKLVEKHGATVVKFGEDCTFSEAEGDTYSAAMEAELDTTSAAVPFALVEDRPSFQGGDPNAFSEWVNANLRYPEEAVKASTQGRVTLQFTIDTDGSLKDVHALRVQVTGDQSKGKLLADEAVRVISTSPKWKPGAHEGKYVKVVYNFPVVFHLRDKVSEKP